MKESAQIALSYVQARAGAGRGCRRRREEALPPPRPAGAIPKDGPSARILTTTALVSLLSGRPVKEGVGMTGESPAGRVLAIGGVKQKVLAAQRAGLHTVVLPQRNGPDLDDVPEVVRDVMTFHLVDDVRQVLELAAPRPTPSTARKWRRDGWSRACQTPGIHGSTTDSATSGRSPSTTSALVERDSWHAAATSSTSDAEQVSSPRTAHRFLDASETVGLDRSRSMLAAAAAHVGPRLRFAEADIAEFPNGATAVVGEDPFDVVLAERVAWVPADHEHVLASWSRARRPRTDRGAGPEQRGSSCARRRPRGRARACSPRRHGRTGWRRPAIPCATCSRPSATCAPRRAGFSRQHVRLQVYGHHHGATADVVEWVKGTNLAVRGRAHPRRVRRLPRPLPGATGRSGR